jgi:integrase
MTLLRLPYIHRFKDRHGRTRYYARPPGRKQVPLRGVPGDQQFMTDYHSALSYSPRETIGADRTKVGSVSDVIIAYYKDNSFCALAEGTRMMRRAVLEQFRAQFGDRPLAPLRAQHIVTLLGTKKPFAAKNWLKSLRGLMAFGVAPGRIAVDPTVGIKTPKARAGEIHSWTEAEIEQFEAWHPIGSRPRLALTLLLYTALRRGDAVRVGRQHLRNGALAVRLQKTGQALEIPVHPTLAMILEATPGDNMTFLVAGAGKPFSPAGFGNVFRQWCEEAGLPKRCSAHGLRKAACRRLAEAGASTHQIAAISGHRTLSEVARYTQAAQQKMLARAAMATITKAFPAIETGTQIGKPTRKNWQT